MQLTETRKVKGNLKREERIASTFLISSTKINESTFTMNACSNNERAHSSVKKAGLSSTWLFFAVATLTTPMGGKALLTGKHSMVQLGNQSFHGGSVALRLKGRPRYRYAYDMTMAQKETHRSHLGGRCDTILRFRNNDNNFEYFNFGKSTQRKKNKYETEKADWISWLKTGKSNSQNRRRRVSNSYGHGDVKLREDERLGGLPRAVGYSSKDWWHNFVTLPNSAILRDVRSPFQFMFGWGTFVAAVYSQMKRSYPTIASHMAVPCQPHSLVVSALGLLLVFRTNSAYQRFVEGRKIWEEILSTARDLSRKINLYESSIGSKKKRIVLQLLAAYPYLLRNRIQPQKWSRKIAAPPRLNIDPENMLLLYDDKVPLDNDSAVATAAIHHEGFRQGAKPARELCYVDKRKLPWRLLPKNAIEGCAGAQNRPLWICDRIAKELMVVKDDPYQFFSNRERMALLAQVDKLSQCIGQCERIHQTVVPLNYARHSLRSLSMWLLTLPFALVKDFGFFTGFVSAFMSWLLFGVYEIGCNIEDPFQGTLRLSILCDGLRKDVLGEDLHRETAFQLPEYDDDDDDEYDIIDLPRLDSAEKKMKGHQERVPGGASNIIPMDSIAARKAALPLVPGEKGFVSFYSNQSDKEGAFDLKCGIVNGTFNRLHDNPKAPIKDDKKKPEY